MRNFLKIAQGVDVMPLVHALFRNQNLWHADTYMRDYPQGPFGETDSILLRFPVKSVKETEAEVANHLSQYDQHECIDYPAYASLPEARPLIMNLMSYVGGTRLGRCVINRVKVGGCIFPHSDTPAHAEYWERHHIVLQAGPGVDFRCEDEHVTMLPGEIWWFNNALEHEVINNSGHDRIHLVVDIRSSRP
ncbi:aspartyl/asparaginyl beta-hydroxylase domain-containing protein [Pseudomonas carnis]|uniref:aspartyl/asparaginyl beta-hydroxylase domain-containing protein n=1 Tax=Pseudomonas carnis TaxID=2487355 RepID=UPI0018E60890|nr:aspartyl/asparaginyl beta-hydroxylase domain-containing protein [Pseudomonas carnis]MBI6654970.1 aspartyl/asparaginyl beta-hydroxylase domain-containing protein [Pseudomonas carnis]MBI6660168.1 aspartyl/asparaginyl beta-hydroxylase domain-containing protein [Pseudomonas carnis]MBI6687173.1 aspartyl/asparaginyl beta-hydroxylase domain-containing protein [Pseudomonas carnis]